MFLNELIADFTMRRPRRSHVHLERLMNQMMRCAIFFLYSTLSVVTCSAAEITFGSNLYESVDWTSVNATSNVAIGSAMGVGITYSTVNIADETVDLLPVSQYAADSEFDSLSYGPGSIESFMMFAGTPGSTTITFDSDVDSVLMMFGSPGVPAGPGPTGLNLGQWDFSDDLSLSVIDGNGLAIDLGNVIYNSDVQNSSGRGVVRIARLDNASFTSLSYDQNTTGGNDGLQFSMAVTSVPEPVSTLFLVILCAVLALYRHRSRC